MKRTATLLCAVALVHAASCSPGVKRVIEPFENRYIDIPGKGAALARSAACDVFIEHVDPEKWKKLLSFSAYSSGNPLTAAYRVPPFEFFQVVVRNTSDQPIAVEDCYVRWRAGKAVALGAGELRARCRGGSYRIYDFEGLLSFRRVVRGPFSISEMDYAKNTIGLRLQFIPAGDSVLFIRAFDWIPVEADSFDVVLVTRAGGRSSSVSMTMSRREYRTRGKKFAEPRKNEEEDGLDLEY